MKLRRSGAESARFCPWRQRRCRSSLTASAILAWVAFFVPLLRAAAPPTPGMQQSFTGDNVTATLLIPAESVPRFGFVPLRVAIDNRQSRDLRWQASFALSSNSNFGYSTLAQSSTALVATAGRSAERWVFVPTADAGLVRSGAYYGGGWGNFVVTVDGPAISQKRLQFNAGGRGANNMVPWAVSASLESTVRSHLVALKTDAPLHRGGRPGPALPGVTRPLITGTPNLFVFDPTHPLGDWRLWSPYARVLMRADEFATLPPANRTALRNWVALGGWLYLAPELPLTAGRQRWGAGSIVTLERPIAVDTAHNSEGLFSSDGIFASTPAMPSDLSLQKGGLSDKISPAKPVGDWLVYFFVGFAVLVAPVNLFAIAPVKRRHWLFFSVPLISVVAVAILVGAIYLQDGVGGEGARRSLVVLLPGDNQAAVFQEQVSRTGLLLGTTFPLADDAICAAVAAEDGNSQPGRALEYNRTDGRASGDWFRGRARQAQHLRRLTPTRARIERVGETPDGAPIVQSSAGTTLREFCYLDLNGVPWGAKAVTPGARVTLTRLENADDFVRHSLTFGDVVSYHLRELSTAAIGGTHLSAAPWTRGRFVALAGESDLAPLPTLASIRWKDSAILFTGAVETPTTAKVTP